MKTVVVDLPVLGCAKPCAPTVDLFDALERIETLAKQTQLNIAAGMATSGVCGLRKIELAAQDARRYADAAAGGRVSVAYLNAVRQDPCAYCGARADHLDHVVPKVRGGADTWDNLTATCKPCNSAKTSRSLLGFLGLRRLAAETAWVAPTRSLWSGVGR